VVFVRRACAIFLLLLPWVVQVPWLAQARDDGRYTNNPLKWWFDSLKSKNGFCCSEADGNPTEYDMREDRYWVPIDGVWTMVPEEAVIHEPNRYGRAIVWLTNTHKIRCFIPASGV
jgi:hypothetical protein